MPKYKGQKAVYSKSKRQWVKVEKEKKLDYGSYDQDACSFLISYWRAAPDRLLDVLESDHPMFEISVIQRVIIRAFCLFEEVFITGARGFSKTFNKLVASMLMGILYPGIERRYYGPSMKQTAQIASRVYKDIEAQYPGLCEYWHIESDSEENFTISTDCGSVISISIRRGDTCHAIDVEEAAQEEGGEQFDFEKFRTAVVPTARGKRLINQKIDPFMPRYQKCYITSAGRKQNEAYEYRASAIKAMISGASAFACDIPYEVPVLSKIQENKYYEDLKAKQTPDEQLREFYARWTGTSENPLIRDTVLTESRNLMCMEERHCGNPDVTYIVAYDVSYADGANNAKCASAVCKCEQQTSVNKRDKFMKSFVYVSDNPPPKDARTQARQIKGLWHRFCMDDGKTTYLAIDANSYGKSVVEELHKDLDDGLPPLCCVNHDFPDLEMAGALPVIYAIRATPGTTGSHDPDSEMIRCAEVEWEQGNVRLLISNVYEGINAYKQLHRIKEDSIDSVIAVPYIKTKELCGQIGNLKKTVSGLGFKESRICKSINRDIWSACKYAIRVAGIVEAQEVRARVRGANPWKEAFAGVETKQQIGASIKPRTIGWKGGNTL